MSNNTKQIYVISVFPEIVENFIKYGVLKRSQDKDLLKINMINLRDFSKNKGQIDDKPYGGGAGMVLQAQPLIDATRFAKSNLENYKCIYLSPKGRKMNQKMVAEAANDEDLIIVAGRYEGVDQRFIDLEVDEEWSIGDYILSGGEVAACVIIDSIARMIPGVLGNDNSNVDDSFSNSTLEYPHYTRPEKVENISVPDVLLSGNHQEIRKWRENQALEETKIKRSDLLKKKAFINLLQVILSASDMSIMMNIIDNINQEQIKEIPEFSAGDDVVVQVRVKEGERERLQAFEGVVIAIKNRGINSSFTVRKISHGEGVERVFQTHSPLIASIKVKRRGKVRRSKLYYLRELSGKAARIKEKLSTKNNSCKPSMIWFSLVLLAQLE